MNDWFCLFRTMTIYFRTMERFIIENILHNPEDNVYIIKKELVDLWCKS